MSFSGSDGRDGGAHSGFSDLYIENSLSSFPHESPYTAIRSDPPPKDFRDSGMVRPFGYSYCQQEEYPRDDVISAVEKREDVISAVEKCMKKHVDTLLQLLEGISGRLSQLESHCDKLERSIGDLQSDMFHGQSENDTQLDSLEKHLREVRRSVQILRDKQELAETQKELAKLQSVEKESITAQKTDEDVDPSVSEPKRHDGAPAMSNQCLALVPHQSSADSAPAPLPAVASEQNRLYNEQFVQQPVPAPSTILQDQYCADQTGAVHTQRPPSPQGHQNHPLQHQQHYMQPRTQPQTQQQPFPQYQQQWRQPSPQQTMQPPQPTGLTQTRPHTPAYPPYPPHHQVDRISETYPGSSPRRLQADSMGYETYSRSSPVPFPTTQHSGNRAELVPFGYGPGNTASEPPQHLPRPQGTQTSNSGYNLSLPYPPQKSERVQSTTYRGMDGVQSTTYRGMDGSTSAPPQNFQPGGYLPSNSSAQQNQQLPPRSMFRGYVPYVHPYAEMIEKAVGMGYPRNEVANVIHQMGTSGQPFDFGVLCDRLNSHTVGASQRGWSG